jgi:hypothetical protein
MDSSPLVIDEIYAGREFLERLNEYAPVKAAGWLKRGEDEERYLCVALDGPAGDDLSLGSKKVRLAMGAMKDHYLGPSRIRVLETSDRFAKAVMELYRRYSGPMPTTFSVSDLGGDPIVDAYIYPPLPAKTACT